MTKTPQSYPETPSDFYNLSGPDLLAYCGADASKWSTAFCAIKEAQGWSAADIDEGLMNAWFANAIEHSSQVRSVAQAVPNRMEKGRAFYLAMYEKDGAIWAANDHKGLWCDMAEDYERRLSLVSSTHRAVLPGEAECDAWIDSLTEREEPGWGQIVQLLLRAMDTSPKSENYAKLAERMADGVMALYQGAKLDEDPSRTLEEPSNKRT